MLEHCHAARAQIIPDPSNSRQHAAQKQRQEVMMDRVEPRMLVNNQPHG